jgi:hypothetical protein
LGLVVGQGLGEAVGGERPIEALGKGDGHV